MTPRASDDERIRSTLAALNACWLEGRPDDLGSFLREDVVLVLPGFEGKVQGREAVLGGFRDFCREADVLDYAESDHQIDVVADVAVATYRFRMLYERDGAVWRGSGRDFWILARDGDGWRAAWRTLLEVEEEPGEGEGGAARPEERGPADVTP